jgi:hypothetical protein
LIQRETISTPAYKVCIALHSLIEIIVLIDKPIILILIRVRSALAILGYTADRKALRGGFGNSQANLKMGFDGRAGRVAK